MSDEKRPVHVAAFCERIDMQYSGKMSNRSGGWISKHECPACGRKISIANNYLGRQKIVCTGERFWRPHEQTLGRLGMDNLRALLKPRAA